MIPDAYRPLFDRLLQRSLAGEVNWRPTGDEKVVAVYFKDFSLTLRKDVDVSGPHPEEFVRVEIINQDGKEVDGFFSAESDGDWRDAVELYEAARRKSIRLDEALTQIIGELEEEGPVGRAKPPSAPDDDLPF